MAVIQMPEKRTGFEGAGAGFASAYLGGQQAQTQRMGVEEQIRANKAQEDHKKQKLEVDTEGMTLTNKWKVLGFVTNALESNTDPDMANKLEDLGGMFFKSISRHPYKDSPSGTPLEIENLPYKAIMGDPVVRRAIDYQNKVMTAQTPEEYKAGLQNIYDIAGHKKVPGIHPFMPSPITPTMKALEQTTKTETNRQLGLKYAAEAKTAGTGTAPKAFTEASILEGYLDFVNKFMLNETSDITMALIANMSPKAQEKAIANLSQGKMPSRYEYRALFPTVLPGGISSYLDKGKTGTSLDTPAGAPNKRYSILKTE